MRGTADPFTEVYAADWLNGPIIGYSVVADGSGEWVADFSVDHNITPGSNMWVCQGDEDDDLTVTRWEVPRTEGWQHDSATGHDYLFVEDYVSWTEAEADAVSLGGHLATINDSAENDWLLDASGVMYWIGFNDIDVEGEWVWASGESSHLHELVVRRAE